jgi:integrase
MAALDGAVGRQSAPAGSACGPGETDNDVLYPAYVLVLVLGLRKGELLGLTWQLADIDRAELYIGERDGWWQTPGWS